MDRLKGKVAVYTGGGSGMGKAGCILFAKEGAQVVIADWNEANGKAVEQEIRAAGGDATFIPVNVSDEDSVRNLFKKTEEIYGRVSVLVNNAGILGTDTKFDETDIKDLYAILNIDLVGVFLCIKHVVPYMRKVGGGSIVNMSSICGLVSTDPGLAPYCAAKGAVTMMTKNASYAYAKENIRCNSVHPGTVRTPLIVGAGEWEGGVDAYEKRLAALHPMGRIGEPEEIVYGVLYLASDESSWTTGCELRIDGGILAH